MKFLIYTLLALFPSFIHVGIRRIMGNKIGKGVKLRIGTLIFANKIEIGSGTHIGPLTYIRARELNIGENNAIKALVVLKTLKVKIANYVHIAPLSIMNSEFTENSRLEIGDHCRIFPFCWIDTGEGVTMEEHVGVGGHTLMFTHGVWSNYVEGGPVSYGPIHLKKNVWLPWRVFILPNVTIGENCIIGANSLINSSIEDNTLAAGTPAKVIRKLEPDTSRRTERFTKILEEYAKYTEFKYNSKPNLREAELDFGDVKIIIDNTKGLRKNDLLVLINEDFKDHRSLLKQGISMLDYKSLTVYMNNNKAKEIKTFVPFLRRFGVRLYQVNTKYN